MSAFQPELILRERAEEYARPAGQDPATPTLPSHLSWRQEGLRYCLPLGELRGVARSRITPVPLSRELLVGLTSFEDTFWPVRRVGSERPRAPGVFTGNVLFLRSRRLALWCDQELELTSCGSAGLGESRAVEECPGLRARVTEEGNVLLEVDPA